MPHLYVNSTVSEQLHYHDYDFTFNQITWNSKSVPSHDSCVGLLYVALFAHVVDIRV